MSTFHGEATRKRRLKSVRGVILRDRERRCEAEPRWGEACAGMQPQAPPGPRWPPHQPLSSVRGAGLLRPGSVGTFAGQLAGPRSAAPVPAAAGLRQLPSLAVSGSRVQKGAVGAQTGLRTRHPGWRTHGQPPSRHVGAGMPHRPGLRGGRGMGQGLQGMEASRDVL